MRGGGARGQNVVHIEHQYSKGLLHVFVSSACMEAHTHTYSHTLTILGRGPDPQCPRSALDQVYKSALYILHTHTLWVGGRTGLMDRASDSGSGDPGSILGRVGVFVSLSKRHLLPKSTGNTQE